MSDPVQDPRQDRLYDLLPSVYRQRDADQGYPLQALLNAGWSPTEVVTLSQLVSFLSFQIRVVAGLKAMNARAA